MPCERENKNAVHILQDPEIINKAIESPENYVLKPQREGGGNIK